MKKAMYFLYAVVLAGVAVFTGEIITFVMLGFVLMSLDSILEVLKDISKKLDQRN